MRKVIHFTNLVKQVESLAVLLAEKDQVPKSSGYLVGAFFTLIFPFDNWVHIEEIHPTGFKISKQEWLDIAKIGQKWDNEQNIELAKQGEMTYLPGGGWLNSGPSSEQVQELNTVLYYTEDITWEDKADTFEYKVLPGVPYNGDTP